MALQTCYAIIDKLFATNFTFNFFHFCLFKKQAASVYPYSRFLPKGESLIWGSARAACAKNACGKLHYPTVGGAVCIILYRGPFVNNTGPSVKFMYTAPPSGVTSSGSCRNSDCRNFNFVYFFIWSLTLKGEKLRIGIKTGCVSGTASEKHLYRSSNESSQFFHINAAF